MKFLKLAATLLLVFTIVLPVSAFPKLQVSAQETASAGTIRILVELKEINVDLKARRDLRAAIREVKSISDGAPRAYDANGRRAYAKDLRRWRLVEVNSSQLASVLSDLQNNPAVLSASVEKLYRTTTTPNDPYFKDQYGLFSASAPLADINASQAWTKTTGSSSNIIAIIDGGVDLNHEDLKDKIWNNNDNINGTDDDNNGFIDDTHGWDFVENKPAGIPHKHGTHVAGIAAASANNNIGIAGIDWGARIMSVRVLGRSGVGREGDIVSGINYAVSNGAKVINLSIAGSLSLAIQDAVENAYASGVVVVAAAGNFGRSTDYQKLSPVCSEPNGVNMVLGVGATDEDGEPASFSNYGKCVDISAPGKRIYSTIPGGYTKMSGTSMSAPLAAGVASLYLSAHPTASPAQVIAALSNGVPFTGRRAKSWNQDFKGKLDAAKALGITVNENITPTVDRSSGQPQADQQKHEPELTITKTGPDQVQPNETFTYTINITNSGLGNAANVLTIDRIDRDTEFVSATGNCTVEHSKLTCTHGQVSAKDSAPIAITYKVKPDTRCPSTLRSYTYLYADERGRSRRQVKTDRVETKVTCPQS